MHGVKKLTEKQLIEKKKEDEKRIQQYKSYLEECLNNKSSKKFDLKTLELVEKMIYMNTFHYTMWNLRKVILLELFKQK